MNVASNDGARVIDNVARGAPMIARAMIGNTVPKVRRPSTKRNREDPFVPNPPKDGGGGGGWWGMVLPFALGRWVV